MSDFGFGFGVAAIILALCLGPAGCEYINAKTDQIKTSTPIHEQK